MCICRTLLHSCTLLYWQVLGVNKHLLMVQLCSNVGQTHRKLITGAVGHISWLPSVLQVFLFMISVDCSKEWCLQTGCHANAFFCYYEYSSSLTQCSIVRAGKTYGISNSLENRCHKNFLWWNMFDICKHQCYTDSHFNPVYRNVAFGFFKVLSLHEVDFWL